MQRRPRRLLHLAAWSRREVAETGCFAVLSAAMMLTDQTESTDVLSGLSAVMALPECREQE